MYVHKHQLEHLLKPRHYTDEAHFRREMDRIFLPGWHLVGTLNDLPRDGDFVTAELFGRPLVLWNIEGKVRAFLNVCAHRHCTLTGAARGSSERLRCQYHGWEYRPDGRTAKIPDAGCFRPFDRDSARLHPFRAETAGELVFVSLAGDGPSLREHLGEHYATFAESFVPPFRQVWAWEVRIPANWKVPTENTLEMYHLPCLHVKTFGRYLEEEHYTHVLGERSSSVLTTEYHAFITAVQNWMLRRLGVRPTNTYAHHLIHPNTVYIGMDSMRLAEQFVPVDAATTIQRVRLYAVQGFRRNPLARAVARMMRYFVRMITRRILTEDLVVFGQVQRGLAHSPHRGMLGTLEERIYAFHQYLLRECGEPADVPSEDNGSHPGDVPTFRPA